MPGIPKSSRCLCCKRRKIKCDLQWPTCTPCSSANLSCPGPSNTIKFVLDNRHTAWDSEPTSSSPSDAFVAADSPNNGTDTNTNIKPATIVALRSQDVGSGASYGYFRLSTGPQRYPTTVSDRLANQLVRMIDKGFSKDILINASYLSVLPARLHASPAVRDSVALFCASWANYRRSELPMENLVPSKAYGKALRSLQRALQDPKTQLSCETLAAITIMERCNVLFDSDKSHKPIYHMTAIFNVMKKRGPPCMQDELDMLLALENRPLLISYSVAEGGDSFHTRSPWKEAWKQAASGLDEDKRPVGHDCDLNECFEQWPEIVRDVRAVNRDPQSKEMQLLAAATRARATELLVQVKERTPPIMYQAHAQSMLTTTPWWNFTPAWEDTTWLQEADLLQSEQLTGYLTLILILTRMAYDLSVTLGESAGQMYAEYCIACHQTWSLVPFLRKTGPIAKKLFATPCSLALEMVEEGLEKDHAVDYMIEANETKRPLNLKRDKMERWAIDTARSMTGRQPLGEAGTVF